MISLIITLIFNKPPTNQFPITQGCATALILACNPIGTDHLIASSAARSFFRHGGEPVLNSGVLQTNTPSESTNNHSTLLGSSTFLSTTANREVGTITITLNFQK